MRAVNSGCSARQRPRGGFNIALLNSQEAAGSNPTLAPTAESMALHTRPAPDPARQISESWTNSLRQGGRGETVFPTTVGTLQLSILFQSKHNINLSVFLPILWEEICIGNYLSDVNICKHHSHTLVHMKRKNIIKVPAVALTLLSGRLSRLLKSSGYPNIIHSSLQCQLLSAFLFQERAVALSVIIQKPVIKRSKAVSSCVLFPGGTQWYF